MFSWLKHVCKVFQLLEWLKDWNGGIVIVTFKDY
jgi:hypothetical protein